MVKVTEWNGAPYLCGVLSHLSTLINTKPALKSQVSLFHSIT